MQSRNKILIVDDNATNIAILEETLAERYCLQAASSGEEALACAEEFRPELILLDIMMPGIDGYETCRRIRANPKLKQVKIIMVSAKAMVYERLTGYDAGADDYLTKPFDEEELLAKVRVYLRLQSIEEIDQLKSNVLSLLSHETRTPLNGIIAPLELLLSDPDGDIEERKEMLELASESARQLQQLFEKVTKFSAMKASKWLFKFTPTNLSEVLAKATAEVAPLASQRNVIIDQELENIVATIDPLEIQFVAKAILNNAVRFSPAGEHVALALSTGPDHLAFRVIDHGVGMDEQDLSQIFDEFQVSDLAHHTEGQGLSLAIARQVAIAHDGTIDVASQKGCGTTITVKLPMAAR